MFRHIAVGLDGSAHAATATELALGLAGRLGAVVHGVHVIDATFLEGAFITDISGAMGFEPFLNLQSQVRTSLEELAATIKARFEERCRGAGVEHTFQVTHAAVVRGLLDAARLADLLVVGQRGVNARYHEDLLGPTAGALLRRSPVPVLLVPESAVLPRRPLVAWDGSLKAIAALRHAAELCGGLGTALEVVTVDDDERRAADRLDAARAYLAPFGVETAFRREGGEAVEQVLLLQLGPSAADLLCLGAHGHNRIVELVLGSSTDFLARRSPVPVLCATRP
jgi:nucleotide-binding universal stress UspA family protein